MDLGIMIEAQEGVSWDLWRKLARTVEDLGFESLWRSDHFSGLMGAPAGDSLDAYAAMTVLATETRRIRFGPLVSPITFRHPSLVARMAAQIDVLSGGRLIAGVGAGWNTREHEQYALPFPPLKERMDRLDESIRVMKALWADGPATYEGRYYTLAGAECYPKPAQRPMPVLVGGTGERRTLRIVAEHADEWNVVGANVETYRQKREVLERHCADVRRDPASIRHSQMAAFVTGRDDAGVQRHFERIAARAPGWIRDRGGAMASLAGRGWLVGTPAQIVEELGRREEAGMSRFMMQHLVSDDLEMLELVAKEVLPQVQKPAAKSA